MLCQTSLQQVRSLFQRALQVADKSVLQKQRILNIISTLTRLTVSSISLGLYERHKLAFKVVVLLKILVTTGKLPAEAVFAFVRGGGALRAAAAVPDGAQNPPVWLPAKVMR